MTKLQRLLFETIVGTVGLVLVAYSFGWMGTIGIVLMMWANNVGHSRKIPE